MNIFEDMMNQSNGDDTFESRKDSVKLLTLFNSTRINFKAGDYVERNVWGMNRYSFPLANQAAICTKMLEDSVLDEQGNYVNMELTVAIDKNSIRTYLVDSRFYKKYSSK